MTKRTYCKIVGGAIVARQVKDNPEVAIGPDKNPVWRPFVAGSRPSYNPATHHAPVRSEQIEANRVVEVWDSPVAKSAQDLAQEKRARVEAMGDVSLAKLLDLENRVRALEGKSELSEGDFKTDLESRAKAARA